MGSKGRRLHCSLEDLSWTPRKHTNNQSGSLWDAGRVTHAIDTLPAHQPVHVTCRLPRPHKDDGLTQALALRENHVTQDLDLVGGGRTVLREEGRGPWINDCDTRGSRRDAHSRGGSVPICLQSNCSVLPEPIQAAPGS